jgi:hypothetical protein
MEGLGAIREFLLEVLRMCFQPVNRFTLRGQKKVDTQWKLFCLVHNLNPFLDIEKLAHHGYGQ